MTTTGAPATQNGDADYWVSVARSLAPLISAEVIEGEKNNNVTDKVVQALKDSGLYTLVFPESLGGSAADVVAWLAVMEEIARIDASAGWVYMVHSAGSLMAAMNLERETVFELFGEGRRALLCGAGNAPPRGRALKVDGGYLVSALPMPFGSGTLHVDRVVSLFFEVDETGEKVAGPDGKPVVLSGYPHKDNVDFLRNWYPSGLAGTGSGEYAVKEHVLEAKWFASENQENKYDEPILRFGMSGANSLAHTGWALGIMKRALEEVAAAVKAKRRGGIPVPVDEYSLFQFEFVRIESLYQSSRAWAMQVYRDAWNSAISGEGMEREIIRLEQVCTHVNRVMNDVVNTAALWSGSAVIPHDSVMARLTRDMHAGAAHVVVAPSGFPKVAPQILEAWQSSSTA